MRLQAWPGVRHCSMRSRDKPGFADWLLPCSAPQMHKAARSPCLHRFRPTHLPTHQLAHTSRALRLSLALSLSLSLSSKQNSYARADAGAAAQVPQEAVPPEVDTQVLAELTSAFEQAVGLPPGSIRPIAHRTQVHTRTA